MAPVLMRHVHPRMSARARTVAAVAALCHTAIRYSDVLLYHSDVLLPVASAGQQGHSQCAGQPPCMAATWHGRAS